MRIPHIGTGFFGFFLLLIAGLAITWVASCYKKISNILILTDSYVSPTIKQGIRAILRNHYLKHPGEKISARLLHRLVQKWYPFINRVRIIYKNRGRACILISADRPLALLNDEYILTENATLARAEDYADHACNDLFSLKIALDRAHYYQGLLQPTEMSTFIRKLPAVVRERYTCTWHSKNYIALHDKQQPTITLKTDAQTVLDERLLNSINRLVKLIAYRKNTVNRSKKHKESGRAWCLDVRCKNQLVLAQQKGEWGYEESKRYA